MKTKSALVVAIGAAMLAACASAPRARPDQIALEAKADSTLTAMVARDPSLQELLTRAEGYAVFPEVAEGGFIVGAADSVGVLYERGRPTGYVELRGGTIGMQVGAQTYSEIIAFDSREALDRVRSGNFGLTADLRATAVTVGSAATAQFEGGMAVFIADEAGLMASASVGGQQLDFVAK